MKYRFRIYEGTAFSAEGNFLVEAESDSDEFDLKDKRNNLKYFTETYIGKFKLIRKDESENSGLQNPDSTTDQVKMITKDSGNYMRVDKIKNTIKKLVGNNSPSRATEKSAVANQLNDPLSK